MRARSLLKLARTYPALCLVISCVVLSSTALLYAHNGTPLSAPTAASAAIAIDGTINNPGAESVWGMAMSAGQLINNCTEFGTPSQVNLYAVNDGTNLFLAFDIPDTSAMANDVLYLYFDTNHGVGGSPAADDRAL